MTTADRPHWALQCVAAFFAAVAALVIAVMVMLTINNWKNVPLDQVPWVPLAMLLAMLSLLWAGITLARRPSNLAMLVLMLSALLGLPFSLFILAIAFGD